MRILTIVAVLFFSAIVAKSQVTPVQYNIEKDRVLYVVGYAHLDSEWNWDYPVTVNECLKNTMTENYRLFEKYPQYTFNFTGSRRYRLMKEYHPELYKKVGEYIKQGRWFVSGSSVDEGEVNVSSSESVIRQVLYGNQFFRREYGKESFDYMLPDCFGFVANMPSIWNHCGLLGFSTQKLEWGSAVGMPSNVGVWNGPDGKGIIAAFNATDYTGAVVPRLDLDTVWDARLKKNFTKYGFSFDYRYYGVGDEGGAPRPNDIENVFGSMNNKDSKFKVIPSSSDQMYKDITPEIRKKLPVYSGDLLLTEHSAGSTTSQVFMKRINRKNENLAQSAEQMSVMANWLNGAEYPFSKINNAWELVLGSQFHDILPGTSIPKAYEYAWNDEFIATNGFSEVLKHALKNNAQLLNTQVSGRSLVVYNPVAKKRDDVATAEMTFATLPVDIKVTDAAGKIVASQVIAREGNKVKFIFRAQVPSIGMAVYNVESASSSTSNKQQLKVSQSELENEYYKIKVAANGDIESIFDKTANREMLAKPARLEFIKEIPKQWPSWNMDWFDNQQQPIDYLNHDAKITVLENGPVRVALLIKRAGQNSFIEQVLSLCAGESGKRVEIANVIDWQSKEVSLKASFPLVVQNQKATYNLGVGTIKRANNDSTKYEVPSKCWFDLTDENGKYGVSILEDSRYGSDKPNNNTIRLTLMFTPGIGKGWEFFGHQYSQDWGIHDVKYGIYGHKGNWSESDVQWQAEFLNKPLVAFETQKHTGAAGYQSSMLSINTPQVGVMALKKMEDADYYIVRVNELNGKNAENVQITFPSEIIDAYEVNGQEKKIDKVNFKNSVLTFNVGYSSLKSFAVKLKPYGQKPAIANQHAVALPYNFDMFTFDDNRMDCFPHGNWVNSFPAEMIPDVVVSEDVKFTMGSRENRKLNTLECKGQKITLPQGKFNKLYLLAAATDDTTANISIGQNTVSIPFANFTGNIGQHYNREYACKGNYNVTGLQKAFYKSNSNIAWFASHIHQSYRSENLSYNYGYMFKYEIQIPEGATEVQLPDNDKIRIFAATVADDANTSIELSQPLFDDFSKHATPELRQK